MRHVCLSHETSVANTLLKSVLTKLLPALDSREKYRGGGRTLLGELGTVHRNLMFVCTAACLKSSQEQLPVLCRGWGGWAGADGRTLRARDV